MSRQATSAIVAALLLAGMALANAGPPPLPKGRKVVEPPVRFEGIDQYADHVFYLYYRTPYFDFGRGLVEVKGSEPITLRFKTKVHTPNVHMVLLAVEREEFEKRKKQDASLQWLVDAKDGVRSAKLTPPETTVPETVKDVPMTTYRVTLKDGKLGAEKVDQKKSGAASPSGTLPPWTFGIVSSLSIAWLGIWFARRGTPSTSARQLS